MGRGAGKVGGEDCFGKKSGHGTISKCTMSDPLGMDLIIFPHQPKLGYETDESTF
jgi:hypothetical protein